MSLIIENYIGTKVEKVLINTDEYNGLYVAMKSFDDNTIVGVGENPEEAIKDAETKGYSDAVIVYIPEEEVVHIYLNKYII